VIVNLASNGEGDDPATPGADFNPIPNSVVIAPNEVVTDFYVITLDDLDFEPTESFVIRIQDVSNPHVIGQRSAVGFIVDNDQPICGNGTVEEPEQCDDGNTIDGDGCSASCEIEDEDGVTNLNDSGPGSLRQVLADIAPGGSITFDAGLAGGVIELTSGQLTVDRSVTIDASAAPGLVVSGSGISRVFEIAFGAEVSMNDLEVADGAGAFQGGGILNNGTLNLDRVVVRDNTETSGGPASFDFGGGGIYNGDGATLNLTDSTVADNASTNQPGGGVYGFFNSTVNITRSTISGNLGGDVAGGLRTLGNLTVVNSTIIRNVSVSWHGGAAFITDGVATIVNSTITGNIAPAGTAGGLMVATFGAPVSVTVTNSIVANNNGSYDCQVEGGGAASLESGGNNVFADASCSPVAEDIVVVDPLLGPLADYGGPTLTQALQPGSPAIDAANSADCPASDQRGVSRPQGGDCDAGAFELEPL